ncbi:MAG: hypothetical protein KDD76_02535, partial [Rickettsiales bacterium]|nr:hypothetical protein [Rickettsiales bacterium]
AINAQKQYNAGKLPNSPMVLDPIVYAKDPETGKRRPLGSGIVWTTALALGIEKIEQESLARLKDVGVYAGPMYRGQELKGVKAFAMLDKAYMFDAEGIAAWEQHVKATEGETADAFGIPGCQEIFKLSGVSGKQYMSYYLLSGFEYLCGHGSFESRALSDVTGDVFRNK